MDELELRKIIYDYIKEICHFSQMQVFATSSYQKNYFQLQIDEDVSGLINLYMVNKNDISWLQTLKGMEQPKVSSQPLPQSSTQMQQLSQPQEGRMVTIQELSSNDGGEGKPAYVAVNGVVYDMSQVLQWAGGTHFGLYAGQNLSKDFMTCHKGMEVILEKLPKIGLLKS